MKTKFKGKTFEIKYSETLAGGKALFINFYGNSYSVVDDTEKDLMNFHSELGNAMYFVRNLIADLKRVREQSEKEGR